MNCYIKKNHISINEGGQYKLLNGGFVYWKDRKFILFDLSICLFYTYFYLSINLGKSPRINFGYHNQKGKWSLCH